MRLSVSGPLFQCLKSHEWGTVSGPVQLHPSHDEGGRVRRGVVTSWQMLEWSGGQSSMRPRGEDRPRLRKQTPPSDISSSSNIINVDFLLNLDLSPGLIQNLVQNPASVQTRFSSEQNKHSTSEILPEM